MSIKFGPERWEKVRKNYKAWWDGTLDRPLIPVVLKRDSSGIQSDIPLLSQTTCNDLSVSARDIVKRIDLELQQDVYLGDAFPYFNMDCFGPGVVAAFLGAELKNSTGRVWFHPKEVLPIRELHFEYDPANIWLNRIKEIYHEAMAFWHGQVLVGMPDLGGILDILSTFRPADSLLLDLYDEPEEVERLVWEIHELWFRYYNEFNGILQPISPGYSDWGQIYSDIPSYIPQSDFSYMISPDMFEQFTRQELGAFCKELGHTIYHLDGVGQLNHLDSILEIEELDAIQWVPGDGKPPQSEWPEVYQKIHAAGKRIQIFSGFDCLDIIEKQIGTLKGVHHTRICKPVREENVMRRALVKYGVE